MNDHQQIGNLEGLIDILLVDCGETEVRKKGGSMVCEVYSPPRVAPVATQKGLGPGWSLDLTSMRNDGSAWDFNKLEMRNQAIREIRHS